MSWLCHCGVLLVTILDYLMQFFRFPACSLFDGDPGLCQLQVDAKKFLTSARTGRVCTTCSTKESLK